MLKEKLTMIVPPPEREALEKEIASLFTTGDLSDVARLLQKDLSQVSRAFNPFETERHNPVYQLILHLWAFDALRDGLAGEVLNIVLREREKWLPASRSGQSPATLTGNIVEQFKEFMECELNGDDHNAQINEICDVIRAAEDKKRDIIAKRNEKHLGTAEGAKLRGVR